MIPPGEHIIETKTCPISGEQFPIFSGDLEFYDRVSPTFGGKKYSIPTPTLCPRERTLRRQIWRNELGLHHRTCEATGEKILSMYSEESGVRVYNNPYWWSDEWSAHDYGVKPDFERPFFDQVHDLLMRVPMCPLTSVLSTIENSDYCNRAVSIKNCYLSANINESENVYYSKSVTKSSDCVDCFNIITCERCYECVSCTDCFSCHYLLDCRECSDCIFGRSLTNCQNCFGCVNLTNKQYCLNNEQLTPDEYKTKLQTITSKMTSAQILQRFARHQEKFPVRYMQGLANEDVSGDYLYNCQRTHYTFMSTGCENCRYCSALKGPDAKNENNYDVNYMGLGLSHSLECSSTGILSNHVLFCVDTRANSDDIFCSIGVASSKNCFGCVGLNKGSQAVLNTQYSKDEYEKLCGKIIDHMISTGEWGEFFPASMCPNFFDETVACDHHDVTKKDVLARGMKWSEEPQGSGKEFYYTPLPISQYDESVVGPDQARANIEACLKGKHLCESSKKEFRITKQELAFYIDNHVDIPIQAFRPRLAARLARVNTHELHDRMCGGCGEAVLTSYPESRPEKILCEECYLKEIY